MSEEKRFSDFIIESGSNFAVDAMEDYDDRVKSGEFANKSYEEIRQIYLDEAIDREQMEDEMESIQNIIDREDDDEE